MMQEIEPLRDSQSGWRIHWRWEGTAGHPRQFADSLVRILEDRRYVVALAEGALQGAPLSNVADFEGMAVAQKKQSVSAAAKENRALLIVGIVLLPVLIGLVLIWMALR